MISQTVRRLAVALALIMLLISVFGCGQKGTTAGQDQSGANWPDKALTLIVPFKAGGGFDIQARVFAPLLEKQLPNKANVVVKNLAGAGGKTGSMALMRSAPDGYTLGILSPTDLGLMQVSGELENADIRELTWLGQLSWDAGVVVASAKSGFNTPADLKKREVRIAATNDAVFAGSLLAKKMELKHRIVLFDGTGDEALAGIRGDVDIMLDSWTSMKQAVQNSQGQLKPLFVIADQRLSDWPEVPTSKELGLDLGDLAPVAGSARLIAAPKEVPDETKALLQDSIKRVLEDPEFAAQMKKAGYAPSPGSAEAALKTVNTIISVLESNQDVLKSISK